MPEHDDRRTTWREAGANTHPVLAGMTQAAVLIGDAAAFLSPTRPSGEPHLEEPGWPRDLDGRETLAMLGQLAEIVDSAGTCLMGVRSQHQVPDAVKPDLDALADVLLGAYRKLIELGKNAAPETGAAAGVQRSETGIPHTQAAGPRIPGTQPQAAPDLAARDFPAVSRPVSPGSPPASPPPRPRSRNSRTP